MRWLVMLGLVAGCAVKPKSRIIYRDPQSGFSIKHSEQFLGKRGEPGEVHPAVLEYVLANEASPLAAYYELVLAQPGAPPQAHVDLSVLAIDAQRLAAGRRPRGLDYARALARRIAMSVNQALAHRSGKLEKFQYANSAGSGGSWGHGFEGTAALWWGVPVDLEARLFKRDYELDWGETSMRTVIYRYESLGLIVLRSSGTEQQYVWDVSAVPGAFDPRAKLDYDTVARQAIALHPEAR